MRIYTAVILLATLSYDYPYTTVTHYAITDNLFLDLGRPNRGLQVRNVVYYAMYVDF